MKFLSKNVDSQILAHGIVYKINGDNRILRGMLVEEQCRFCAYTEKFFADLDSVDIDHFDSSLKHKNDDYYNYYAVLHKPNLYKKDERYRGSSFFSSKFFQNKDELNQRIKYVKDEFVYEETNPEDHEAKDFIDFLGLNNHDLYQTRKKHLKRLQSIFESGKYTVEDIIQYFLKFEDELSFITLLESELNIDLSGVLEEVCRRRGI